MHRALSLLLLFALLAPQLQAADLSKIARSIRKEPNYETKTPKYCLLVFGPKAQTRVWLVLDGKTLYVDHNGNGDLTEDGEKCAAKKGLDTLDEYYFEVDELRDGPRTHKRLILSSRKLDYLAQRGDEVMKRWLARAPQGRGCTLRVDVDVHGYEGEPFPRRIKQLVSLWDDASFLVFADKPHDAPIVHFGGPRQIRCTQNRPLMIGRERDLMLAIETPGLGAGTTATLLYPDTIPENVHPRVEVTYPPAKPGQQPPKRRYELKERC